MTLDWSSSPAKANGGKTFLQLLQLLVDWLHLATLTTTTASEIELSRSDIGGI